MNQPPVEKVLWIDPTLGASGDMFLGALVDLGVPLGVIAEAVGHVTEQVQLSSEEVIRNGLRAGFVAVEDTTSDVQRTWSEVRALLAASGLHEEVRSYAHDVFARLAEAEAAVHGIDVDAVHFHEVGALDSLADVVGTCAGLNHLQCDHIVVAPVGVGAGQVTTSHGVLPVPVPAVAELLRGIPSHGGPSEGEACTPTGAALLATFADAWGPVPAMVVESIGLGAGQRNPSTHPNVLRMHLGAVAETVPAPSRSAPLVLESNVDDLDPRLWPEALAKIMEAGASDAWLSPIQMKKGRAAHTLHVLTSPESLEQVQRAIYTHTSTIGMRIVTVDKHALEREMVSVEVGGHPIDVKVASWNGEVLNRQPEYEHLRRAAEASELSIKQVLHRAIAAADEIGE